MGRGIKLADVAFLGRVGNQFSPLSFTGLQGFWRADAFPVGTISDGDNVGSTGDHWLDLSGNGRDADDLGGTILTLPTYETNEVNGKPVVRFDTIGEQLAFPELSVNDFTIIIVGRTTVGQDTLWFGHRTVNHQLRLNRAGVFVASFFSGSSEIISGAFAAPSSDFQVTVWRRSGNTVTFRQNKTSRGSGSDNNLLRLDSVCNNTFLGSGRGDLGEVVMYNEHRSDSEVDQLYDNWFKPRWALP